ncbi:MAG: 1-(5-phosphoribosyl)-5-((5-phosphoribosylamino)methylideneamino)imidazole-4-carboxamide isomerase [Sulfobacillus acidophilus]|uniref:1-(5-phosphoribosyl)-5-[(5-phosphoribosylamino)methylideneamino] imidazole-4-carboxamide isomerase n=1 Tax=Sulfobacillus acidophilus TaxID=53633 RepID=A0A2T2WE47_9FIRM|nr:MAG: 1-(5-phosphoribosyl)-5-((5-phosphoribosylamino)methylideneamino)imidazole-4-carboxamide isomerase [Sulfobacillus acidophilus]
MEVWPALDVADGRVVRLRQGKFTEATTYADDPLDYLHQKFDGWPSRLHLVDLTGALSGQFTLVPLIRQLTLKGVRVQTGGGLRTISAIEQALDAGAERVIVGSRLVADQEFRRECLTRFPEQLVVGLDVHNGRVRLSGWREEGPLAKSLWRQLVDQGFRRAQVTDISRDGMLTGVDESFWREWAVQPGEIGAGGGISTREDLRLLQSLGIQSVVVGKAWIEGRIALAEVR